MIQMLVRFTMLLAAPSFALAHPGAGHGQWDGLLHVLIGHGAGALGVAVLLALWVVGRSRADSRR